MGFGKELGASMQRCRLEDDIWLERLHVSSGTKPYFRSFDATLWREGWIQATLADAKHVIRKPQ
jgi:hypothetical protein